MDKPEQQELNLETMPLEELKAAALAEEAKEAEKKPDAVAAKDEDVLDNSAEADLEHDQIIVRSEIDLGDGSGVQVFTGTGATELEALRDQNSKLLDAQRHASKKIHEQNLQKKTEDTRTAQQKTDDEYVIAQRLTKEPTRAIRDVVTEVIAEREAETKRSVAAQQAFVDSHPDYVADRDNGARIMSEVQRLGYNEFTEQSLEKAYQSLKASGLLKIKAEEAGGTTEAETEETERIVPPKVETTQPRSPRKASTVSTRGSGAPAVKTGPTEDELYTMPLDKLRNLANKQLAGE
jgi:hypothetical protein